MGCYILLCILAGAVLAHGRAGFISIDCGIHEDYHYTDNITQIDYISDAQFIEVGTNNNISDKYQINSIPIQLWNLRSFPYGTRNCYTIKQLDKGSKYLIRALFLYGNYDGQDRLPQFDLYLGVNLWRSMNITNPSDSFEAEIITVALTNFQSICLVNTGFGPPFISSLEMRLLDNEMYTAANEFSSLVTYVRKNLGSSINQLVRSPDDEYDRVWSSFMVDGWSPLSTSSTIQMMKDDQFKVPSVVMQTAATPANDISLTFYWKIDWLKGAQAIRPEFHIFMHFAELETLTPSQSRTFNIFLNGVLWVGPFTPRYLLADHIWTSRPGSLYEYDFSLTQTQDSTLRPILNAVEIYYVNPLSELPTDSEDVDAIMDVKAMYQVKRSNWMGDPCIPRDLTWDGLNCNFSSSGPPRIISLNLSSSGLTGNIPTSLARLQAIEYLDLSNNSLTGPIPDFLAGLPSLRLLNLTKNQLTGSVPPALQQRAANGLLTLSINDNQNLCKPEDICGDKKNKVVTSLLIVFLALILTVFLLVVVFLVRRMKRRRHPELVIESRQFTYTELVTITKNFKRVIGEGGFGTVYHGILENGTQVAVKKRSEQSAQGTKEFQAEAQFLTRVHHRNLVSLVGYCKDNRYLALVYEYMAQGNLREHLTVTAKALSWRERLRITLEAAQGLDYLHKGCKPPIIHRDVKTSNILLSHSLEAKISDFGLSMAFHNEALSHIPTVVAGTIGYVDPEYHETHQLTKKSDVYSFGVVILEVLTGQPAILTTPETIHITQWVQLKLAKGDIASVVDARLGGEYGVNSVWNAADIAMNCTLRKSEKRATMGDVVMRLRECLELEIDRERRHQNLNMDSHDTSHENDSIEMVPVVTSKSLIGPSAR